MSLPLHSLPAPEERSIMQSMATTADLRRAPFLAVSGPKELNHTNDEACEGVARRAAGRMEPSILKKYQDRPGGGAERRESG